MDKKKKKRGRPRIYPDAASRQRAYYQRKKNRLKELEERVAKLEKQLQDEC